MILSSNVAQTLFSYSPENKNTFKQYLLLIDIHVYTGQVGMSYVCVNFFFNFIQASVIRAAPFFFFFFFEVSVTLF